jgi:TPP-dependent pyruvate/acetoin dehydrogenase alpha subunit
MAVKSTAAPVAEPTTSWENPLIPNKKLRELYAAMVELRLLEEQIATIQRRRKFSEQFHLHHGEEACLVSTALSLNTGDVTSESSTGIAASFLRGAKLNDVLSRTATSARPPNELPPLADTSSRLHLAIGAAVALSSKKKSSLAVAYVHAEDLPLQQWKPTLKLAATSIAPVLFVVLTHPEKASKPGQLSLTSTACGVPGIPVDTADPIALYRVAQESILRIRAGGGPVLMECIPFQLPGKAAEPTDPILRMQQLLLPRGIAAEVWFDEVASRFAARLKADAK